MWDLFMLFYLSLKVTLRIMCQPCFSTGKESTCNAGDLGLIPGLGRSPGEAKGYPLQYSGLENSMDYSPWGCKESDMTERLSVHFCLFFSWENWSSENLITLMRITESGRIPFSPHPHYRLLFVDLKKYIFFLFNVCLCWVFVAVQELSLVVASRSYSSSQYMGFSLPWLLLYRGGSRCMGFSSCSMGAQ